MMTKVDSKNSDATEEITLFADLDIDKNIKITLEKMNMSKMTPIQAKCIPYLLNDKDLMGAAKTGSGKTLAFLVPLVNKLIKNNLGSHYGTMAIILSPTRELSQQIFQILEQLLDGTKITSALMVGGKNRKEESKYLQDGITVIVATPGRLKDHLYNTEHFLTHRLHTLIIDEADRLMDQGFFEDMHAIVKKLPTVRQTVLFSATLKISSDKLRTELKQRKNDVANIKKASTDDKVLTLASLSLKKSSVYVDISTDDQGIAAAQRTSTVSQLVQSYIVTEPQDRFNVLYQFLNKNKMKKVMVFMSTSLAVKYYCDLFRLTNLPVLSFHGKMKQSERERNFSQFKDNDCGIILCTDVAARGLDIPQVDWVLQFDPPSDYKEYIHRVGRTARAGHSGQALLFLREHELGFLSILAQNKIPVTEVECNRIVPMQEKLEQLVQSMAGLKLLAEAAFISLTKAYNVYSQKCFDMTQLDLKALAKTFGLSEPPRVMYAVSMKSKKRKHGNDQIQQRTVKLPRKEPI